MLAVKTYEPAFVAACRARIDDRVATAPDQPYYFHDLAVVLDRLFVHRQRGLEDKKGSLRDLRDLADAEPTKLSEADFRTLADGAFAEIEARFS
jgi:hypothetical protein